MQKLIPSHNESVSIPEKAQILGVQYLKNFLGQNTAVLIDLKEHSELWTAVEKELEIPLTVQFLIDDDKNNSNYVIEYVRWISKKVLRFCLGIIMVDEEFYTRKMQAIPRCFSFPQGSGCQGHRTQVFSVISSVSIAS